MRSNLNLAQKILLFSLYGLIILMIVFSIGSLKNRGEEGYNKCVQAKCDLHGEDWCNKYREKNNCCLGAGGELAVSGNQYICVFS